MWLVSLALGGLSVLSHANWLLLWASETSPSFLKSTPFPFLEKHVWEGAGGEWVKASALANLGVKKFNPDETSEKVASPVLRAKIQIWPRARDLAQVT